MTCWAGLLYASGAWWVMSVRGAGAGDVIRDLRRMAPGYRRDRYLAIPWQAADEAAYREAMAHGGYLVIRFPEHRLTVEP